MSNISNITEKDRARLREILLINSYPVRSTFCLLYLTLCNLLFEPLLYYTMPFFFLGNTMKKAVGILCMSAA
jgi:hypothetical protein